MKKSRIIWVSAWEKSWKVSDTTMNAIGGLKMHISQGKKKSHTWRNIIQYLQPWGEAKGRFLKIKIFRTGSTTQSSRMLI
jgi:hypothetical protein